MKFMNICVVHTRRGAKWRHYANRQTPPWRVELLKAPLSRSYYFCFFSFDFFFGCYVEFFGCMCACFDDVFFFLVNCDKYSFFYLVGELSNIFQVKVFFWNFIAIIKWRNCISLKLFEYYNHSRVFFVLDDVRVSNNIKKITISHWTW